MRDAETEAAAQRKRPSAPPSRPREETARLGNVIYERDIRQQVAADHRGEVVAVDVETGNWATGGNVIDATDRLWEKCPDAYDVRRWRVGYRTLRRFGGRPLRETR